LVNQWSLSLLATNCLPKLPPGVRLFKDARNQRFRNTVVAR
jgi:hypothetical protein